jgi:glutamine synthetase
MSASRRGRVAEGRRRSDCGDNYTAAWAKEAEKRGLPNVRNCVDSLNDMVSPENAAVLIKHGTLPRGEIDARHEILLENYAKVINIEAKTMLNMARRQILPAIMGSGADVADGVNSLKAAGVTPEAQSRLLKRLNESARDMEGAIDGLAAAVESAAAKGHADKKAAAYRDLVVPAMVKLRAVSDGIEPVVSAEYWPLPTYADMLFYR